MDKEGEEYSKCVPGTTAALSSAAAVAMHDPVDFTMGIKRSPYDSIEGFFSLKHTLRTPS
jgi:hypothetical protein